MFIIIKLWSLRDFSNIQIRNSSWNLGTCQNLNDFFFSLKCPCFTVFEPKNLIRNSCDLESSTLFLKLVWKNKHRAKHQTWVIYLIFFTISCSSSIFSWCYSLFQRKLCETRVVVKKSTNFSNFHWKTIKITRK